MTNIYETDAFWNKVVAILDAAHVSYETGERIVKAAGAFTEFRLGGPCLGMGGKLWQQQNEHGLQLTVSAYVEDTSVVTTELMRRMNIALAALVQHAETPPLDVSDLFVYEVATRHLDAGQRWVERVGKQREVLIIAPGNVYSEVRYTRSGRDVRIETGVLLKQFVPVAKTIHPGKLRSMQRLMYANEYKPE